MEFRGIAGIGCLIAVCYLLSESRRDINWRVVASALLLQFFLAVLLLKIEIFQSLLIHLNRAVSVLEEATQAGTQMVFGYLGGAELPFAETYPGASFVLAFRALPLVIVIGALSALLFHWRVLPLLIRGFAWLLQKGTGISGVVGFGAAANVFLGMVESPLLVRPYLSQMTRGQLFMVMTCGMATVAGSVMILYASVLGEHLPNALGHILIASLISAPAAILFAELLVPSTEIKNHTDSAGHSANFPKFREPISQAKNAMDAVVEGAQAGLSLFLNIIAMLIVMVALVYLANQMLLILPTVGGDVLSLQRLLGWLLSPVMWLIGVPWHEAQLSGSLMGVKIVLNELLAFIELGQIPADELSEHSRLITVYALCGFANFGSIGIMVGGLGAMVPELRSIISSLALKTIVSGAIATLSTGAVVGLLT